MPDQLTEDERSMVCSCLLGWMAYEHNADIAAIVESALRKMSGSAKVVVLENDEDEITAARR